MEVQDVRTSAVRQRNIGSTAGYQNPDPESRSAHSPPLPLLNVNAESGPPRISSIPNNGAQYAIDL